MSNPITGNVKNIYPLSPMQEGMLFHYLSDSESHSYFQQISWRVHGEFDTVMFEYCWNELIRRHDILRTLIVHENTDRPVQVVLKQRRLDVCKIDLSSRSHEGRKKFIRRFKAKDRAECFDLTRDMLMRVSVLCFNDEEFEVVLSHHHIIMDGWSLGILIGELLELYRARRNAKHPELSFPRPFSEYIKWLERQDADAASKFWKNYLSGYENAALPPQIPKNREILPAADGIPASLHFNIDTSTTRMLGITAARHEATLNTLLHCAWGILLSRYNNSRDVVFGAVVSGRPATIQGIERMVGICINTIAVRIQWQPDMTVGGLIRRVQENALACEPHQYYPLVRVQSLSALGRRLLGTVLVTENYPLEEAFDSASGDHEYGFTVGKTRTFEQTHYDFGIRFVPGEKIGVKIGYNAGRYDHQQVERIKDHLLTALGMFAGCAEDTLIGDLDILSPAERNDLQFLFNHTAVSVPREKTIVDLFDAQVAQHPHRNAIVSGKKSYSYKDVDDGANRIALFLRNAYHVGSEDRVGVLMDRGGEMVIAILGVLKAGGAYVPLASSYPDERIRFILSDSHCRVLLTDAANHDNAVKISPVPVENAAVLRESTGEPKEGELTPSTECNLAYVIYTSGSTGEPKGVMIEHHSVVNLVCAMNKRVYSRYEGKLNVAMVTPFVFDGSVQQMFTPLTHGHTLFIVDDAVRRDNRQFLQYLVENDIHITGSYPNFLSVLIKTPGFATALAGLKHFFVGSEALHGRLADAVCTIRPSMGMTNLYGPTECCVNTTSYDVVAGCGDLPVTPIGKPLPNVQVYILDRDHRLSPIGVPGEICISGAGLARGYMNNDALTQEKFIPHPYQKGRRLYLTGDRGRWLPDGNIEFMDRKDDQVKVRGYRIEPGEIENRLHAHPLIRQAAVIAKKDGLGLTFLCGCIVGEKSLSIARLRDFLSQKLPEYMIPAHFIRLAKLPVGVNGKMDRRALSEIDVGRPMASGVAHAPPQTPMEKKLADVWKAVLNRDGIGIDDNYFALGGDSIKAIQMVSRLMGDNLIVEIRDVFDYPTIRQLAPRITEAGPCQPDDLRKDGAGIPLTSIQRQFLAGCRRDPHWYNHAIMLKGPGELDVEAVRRVFSAIQSYHEPLRFRFFQRDGDWVQEVADAGTLPLGFEFVDIRGGQGKGETIRRYADAAQRSFDLSAGPLMKILFFRAPGGDRVLIVIHHLVIDGFSWRILLDDFTTGYHQATQNRPIRFFAKTDSFSLWAAKAIRYAQSDTLMKEKQHWAEATIKPVSVLQCDHESDSNRHKDFKPVSIQLSGDETQQLLTGVNHAYTTTTQDILLTALMRAIYRKSGLSRVPITLEGHGRDVPAIGLNVSRTVGWFTCMYPVIIDLPVDRDLGYQVKAVKETLRKVPGNGVGYGILRYLTPGDMTSDLGFGAGPRIRFNYMGQITEYAGKNGFEVSFNATGNSVGPEVERSVELDIGAMVINGALELDAAYNAGRFNHETVAGLMAIFQEQIGQIISHCRKKNTPDPTPGDLTYSELSLEELEGIIS